MHLYCFELKIIWKPYKLFSFKIMQFSIHWKNCGNLTNYSNKSSNVLFNLIICKKPYKLLKIIIRMVLKYGKWFLIFQISLISYFIAGYKFIQNLTTELKQNFTFFLRYLHMLRNDLSEGGWGKSQDKIYVIVRVEGFTTWKAEGVEGGGWWRAGDG